MPAVRLVKKRDINVVMYMDATLTDATWSDPKKYAWPLALSVPGLAFTGFVAWRFGFAWAWWACLVLGQVGAAPDAKGISPACMFGRVSRRVAEAG